MAVDKPKQPKLDVDQYLSTAISATPAVLHPYFERFRDLHSRKYVTIYPLPPISKRVLTRISFFQLAFRLWHQITLKLVEFFDDPLSQPYQVDVYDRFVRDFTAKLNPLKLVEMGVKVSSQIDSAYLMRRDSLPTFFSSILSSDPSDHIGFLSDILSRIDKDKSQEAYVLLLATIARAKLIFGDIEGTKADMDAAWKVLDDLSGVDGGVNAAYYSIAADYYKVIFPSNDLFCGGLQRFA